MKNEVLAKIVAHNICCLISAMFELGLDPVVWSEEALQERVVGLMIS